MKLYASPNDVFKSGFVFYGIEDYTRKLARAKQQYSCFEHTIEAISGCDYELALFNFISVDSDNISAFFDVLFRFSRLNADECIAILHLIETGDDDPFGNYSKVNVVEHGCEYCH